LHNIKKHSGCRIYLISCWTSVGVILQAMHPIVLSDHVDQLIICAKSNDCFSNATWQNSEINDLVRCSKYVHCLCCRCLCGWWM